MKVIHKFKIEIGYECSIFINKGAAFIDIQMQDEEMYVWFELDINNPKIRHKFTIKETGDEFCRKGIHHLKTVHFGNRVWHVYHGVMQ